MPHRRASAIAIVLIAASSLPLAQGWIDYENREDRFSVNFPGQPTVASLDWPGEYGPTFPGRVYAFDAGGARYSVTVIDYTNARAIHANMQKNQADELPIYADLDPVGSIQYAATKLYRKRPGATVTYDAYHYIDLVSGQQAPQPGLFQQPLSFLDEKGERVRHNEIYYYRPPPRPGRRDGGAGPGGRQ
jgi:hypothetical protein